MDSSWFLWLYYLSSCGVWLALIAVKSCVLLAAVEGIVLASRSLSASARHTYRLFGLLALLLLPLLSLLLPSWNLGLIEGAPETIVPKPAAAILSLSAAEDVPAPGGVRHHGVNSTLNDTVPSRQFLVPVDSPQQSPLGHESQAVPWNLPVVVTAVTSCVWLLGICFLLGRLLLGLFCVWFARFRSKPVSDGRLKWLASATATRLHFKKPIALYTTPRLEVALSVGILKPAVLLPSSARTWSEGRVRSILLHEFSHARRRDNLWNLVSEVACAFFWVNPLVWLTAGRLRIDRERACDDQVLETGTKASDYAGHLLEVARAVSSRRLWGSLEVSQASLLKDRFQALLNPTLNRRALTESGLLGALVVIGTILAPVSVAQPWKALGVGDAAVSLELVSGTPEKALPKLRRSSDTSEPAAINPNVSLADELAPPLARQSILGSPPELGEGRAAQAPRASGRRLAKMPQRAITRVVATGNVVDPVENARRMAGLSELLLQKRTGRAAPPSAEQSGRSLLPVSSVRALAPVETPGDGGEGNQNSGGGGFPQGDREIEVAEVVTFDLGTLGMESEAADINDSGFVVGQSRNENGLVRPFIWTKTVGMVDLGQDLKVHTRALKINSSAAVLCETFDTFVFRAYVWSVEDGLKDIGSLDSTSPLTVPQAMNEAGHVVGSSRGQNGSLKAFFWTLSGGIREIAPGWSEALFVNNQDQVVGYSDNRAFIWSESEGLQFIGPEDALFSTATSVNALGQVVGWARHEDDQPRAFYWSQQEGLVDLGVLSAGFPFSVAQEISDQGVVVGHSYGISATGEEREVQAFRWTLKQGMESLGRAPSESRIAMNAVGQIVGTNFDQSNGLNPLAYLWTEEGRVELTVSPEPAAFPSEGVAINNKGQIAGNTSLEDELTRAYLWEVRFRTKLVSDK